MSQISHIKYTILIDLCIDQQNKTNKKYIKDQSMDHKFSKPLKNTVRIEQQSQNQGQSDLIVSDVLDDDQLSSQIHLFYQLKKKDSFRFQSRSAQKETNINNQTEYMESKQTKNIRFSLGIKSGKNSNDREEIGGLVENMTSNPTTSQSSGKQASIGKIQSYKSHFDKSGQLSSQDPQNIAIGHAQITARIRSQYRESPKDKISNQREGLSLKNFSSGPQQNEETILLTKTNMIKQKTLNQDPQEGIEGKSCFCCLKSIFRESGK